MKNLGKDTIDKMILELQKALKKLEEKKKNEGRVIGSIKTKECEKSIGSGRVIGTLLDINDIKVDFGIKFSEDKVNTINLMFNELFLSKSDMNSIKKIVSSEVNKNNFLNKYNLEID